jgi:cytochrome c553
MLDSSLQQRGGRAMNLIGKLFATQTAALVILSYAAGGADAAGHTKSSPQSLRAKIEYCTTCHGPSGQGYHGFFPMPRLAGQQIQYIENQLRAFDERRRQNQYMYGVAHALSPAMRMALARHFNELNPRPLAGGSKGQISLGKKIYEEGLPEANVPACMACHGAEAKGHGEIPRLAGQLPDYIVNKLMNWSKERGLHTATPDTSAVMAATSHSLNRSQTSAIAAYVNSLR